jgi:hypothetical protein
MDTDLAEKTQKEEAKTWGQKIKTAESQSAESAPFRILASPWLKISVSFASLRFKSFCALCAFSRPNFPAIKYSCLRFLDAGFREL